MPAAVRASKAKSQGAVCTNLLRYLRPTPPTLDIRVMRIGCRSPGVALIFIPDGRGLRRGAICLEQLRDELDEVLNLRCCLAVALGDLPWPSGRAFDTHPANTYRPAVKLTLQALRQARRESGGV